MVGLLQEVDVPSCTPRMHKNDLIQSESGLSYVVPFLHPSEMMLSFPSNCTQTPNPSLFLNGMFPYHAVFGHRMSGSKAARRMFLLKRVRDPNIKTSELQRLGSTLDAVEGGQAVQLIQKLVENEMGIQ